jgi:Pirin
MDLRSRKVARVIQPEATSDGAGVKLKRGIGSQTMDYLDPFLLFDHFGSENSDDYSAGFPIHPHRGIETVTYMLAGAVEHRDSSGNAGIIDLRQAVERTHSALRPIRHEHRRRDRAGIAGPTPGNFCEMTSRVRCRMPALAGSADVPSATRRRCEECLQIFRASRSVRASRPRSRQQVERESYG